MLQKTSVIIFFAESLKVAHKIWHYEKFNLIPINIDKAFKKTLGLKNEEEFVDMICNNAENIPLFYREIRE